MPAPPPDMPLLPMPEVEPLEPWPLPEPVLLVLLPVPPVVAPLVGKGESLVGSMVVLVPVKKGRDKRGPVRDIAWQRGLAGHCRKHSVGPMSSRRRLRL